jgi:hypothetical protein
LLERQPAILIRQRQRQISPPVPLTIHERLPAFPLPLLHGADDPQKIRPPSEAEQLALFPLVPLHPVPKAVHKLLTSQNHLGRQLVPGRYSQIPKALRSRALCGEHNVIFQETPSILIIPKDGASLLTSQGDMLPSPFPLDTQRSSHSDSSPGVIERC